MTDAKLAVTGEAILARLNALGTSDRRQRLQIIGLAMSVALDVVLTIAVIIGLNITNDTQAKYARLNNATISSCLSSNVARAEQRALWVGILNLAGQGGRPKPTPAVVRQFNALLNRDFAQRDCRHVP